MTSIAPNETPGNKLLSLVIAKLDRGITPDNKWPDSSGEYWSLCPFHDDKKPGSFSVSQKGFNCFACGENGSLQKLATKLGIVKIQSNPENGQGLTIEAYARAKSIDVNFLKDLHITDRDQKGQRVLRIPYLNKNGEEVAVRFRVGLDGNTKFWWSRGSHLIPYGIWKINELLHCCSNSEGESPYLILVEGECDTHTLWMYGIPALGLPGATTWKPEWLEYLQGFRVYVWKEPGQVGEQFLNSIAMSDPDIWIIQPPPNRKDISECHVAGDDIPVLIEKLRNESTPYKSVLEKQRKDEADKAYKDAKTLLYSNILGELDQLIGHLGVVGEERNAKLLYLVVTSRLLDQPVSVVMKGPSSAGKSFIAKAILKLFPERAFYALSGMSEHALAYSVEPLNHRMLVVYEAAGLDTKFASYLLRTLLSEGHIRYETVESTNDGLVPRLINRDGPTGAIITTTSVSLHPENETRLLSLYVRDDRHQTKKIMLTLAEQAAGSFREELDLSSWHALQTWLDLSGVKVVTIPYARILAENTIEASIRMRRDFGLVLSLIKTNAILYQCQRDRDKTGNIIATLDDYATVYTLIIDLLSDAAQISVSKIVRETVQAVQDFLEDKPDGSSMSIRHLADFLQLDKAAASRRAKTAAELGYLTNLEDRKGKPAQFTLAEALPDDKEALPHPDLLKKLLQETPPKNSSTVQHSFSAGELTAVSDRPKELIHAPNSWPDISHPCPVCGTMSWLEQPIAAGGGSYCSVCHP